MSTKTLRKRIALVAVSALTAGLVSVVAVPSANAADGTISATTGSLGLVSGSTIAGSGVTRTATLLSTGKLVVTGTAASVVVVSSGAYISAVSGGAADADQKCATITGANTATITPTGAVGSTFTVTTYNEDTCAAASVIADIVTVTIAGSSLSGTVSPSNSYVLWTRTDSTAITTEDGTHGTTTTGNVLRAYVQLRDSYKADISATTGALIVTASAGAYVNIGTGAVAAGTAATAVSAADPSPLVISVGEATAGAGWSGTITVTYNGVVVATKSGTILGAPASIAVTPKKVGSSVSGSTSNADAFEFVVKDKSGNQLGVTSTNLTLSSSSNTSVVSNATGNSTNATTTTAGKGDITCVAGATGSSDVVLQLVNSDGTIVKSNAAKFTCGGNAYTYSAAFDKASYTQGDIAKLTISFKDSKGAVANSYSAISAGASLITAPMLTAVGLDTAAIPSATRADGNGNLVVTYSVGTTGTFAAGKFNALVDMTVSLADADVVTATYSVSEAGTGTSNAAILKAIVSLIASINKQIALLQKALLKK